MSEILTDQELAEMMQPIEVPVDGQYPHASLSVTIVENLPPFIPGVEAGSLLEVLSMDEGEPTLRFIGRYSTAMATGMHSCLLDEAAGVVHIPPPAAYNSEGLDQLSMHSFPVAFLDRLRNTNRTLEFAQKRRSLLQERATREAAGQQKGNSQPADLPKATTMFTVDL